MINEHDRVLICKKDECWHIISDPKYGVEEIKMTEILYNSCNEYVETKNCGIINRMIRYKDLMKYGFDDISRDSILPQVHKNMNM